EFHCHFFVWKDLPHYRMESRLLLCTKRVVHRNTQSAPIHGFYRVVPHASGPGTLYERPGSLPGIIEFLPAKTRSSHTRTCENTLQTHAQSRHVLPACRLQPDIKFTGS